jgi:hypothetical protein
LLRLGGGAAVLAGLLAAVAALNPAPRFAAAQPAEEAAADLALVPADAVGFVHVRLADLWKNEMFAPLRKTWERAGDKAIGALDEQFVPAPSSINRVTGFVLIDPESREPQPFGVINFSKPFDPAQVVKAYLPGAKKKQVGQKTVYIDAKNDVAVAFPDHQNVLLGMPGAVEAYLGREVAKQGPMVAAMKLARTRPIVAAARVTGIPIPPQALKDLPADVRPLLQAELITLSVDLGAESKVEVRARYKDAAAAGEADKSARALIAFGRKELAKAVKELESKLYDPKIETPRPPDQLPEAVGSVFALGALGRLDDILADPKLITREDRDLAITASIPRELVATGGAAGAIALGFALPAIQKIRAAAARTKSMNNLNQIGLAIHSYHDANNRFPEDIKDKNGKPILSWRVAILPYIEQQALYNQFKLDEPWDSANNKKLSQARIPVFESPQFPPPAEGADSYGLTYYKGIAGPGTMFDPKGKLSFADVTDGLSNTVMVIEDGDPIPWAKPGDYPFDPKKPLPKLTAGQNDVVNMLMGDGSVRAVNLRTVEEKRLKAAFTRSGGEVIGLDD